MEMLSSQPKGDSFTEFKVILRDNCFSISTNEEANSITQEQSLVVRDIEKFLGDPQRQKENAAVILKGLKKLCSKKKYFKKALLPSLLKKEGLHIAIEQDSLIRILLKINLLQNEVIELILDEITSTVSTEDDDPSWLRLLLSPLKYLPSINKSEELTTKLLDILEICSHPMQLEILDILPEILPDNHYNQAAKQLVTFLNTNDSPTAAIVDCLSALNLDDDVKAEIQDIILLKILPGRTKNFPVLMEFLLGNSKGSNSTLMFRIRDALDSAMSSTKASPEKDSTKVLIFTKLKLFITTRKQFAQDCIDMINAIKVSTDHKSIDILLLFLLHSVARNKKRVIELIFRKKVKEGILKYELLEKLFQNYMPQQIFKDRFYSIVEIGCNLIRTSEDPTVKFFSENLFKLLFVHKNTEGIYRKEILDNLLLLAGGNDKKYIDQVLHTFLVLIRADIDKFKQHTIIMMRLLEKMDSFDLDAIKGVFEILCSLTCADENDESMMSMRDEVHMIIRKQLSSSKKNIKFRGVIGAVVMAKHISEVEDDDEEHSEIEDENENLRSINTLPQGKAKNAAKLIEMANSRVEGCYECMGLFYDQLAVMLHESKTLEKHFLTWLTVTIKQDFFHTFVESKVPNTPHNDITYSPQFSLNSDDEGAMIDIGLMTVKPQDSGRSSVLILASHFRLMRLLIHKKYNGNLTTLEELLGCAIILPEVEDIEDLDQDQLRQVTDSLFHCINWFRELISAFIFHKKAKSKVIQRLDQLIELEKQLNDYLSRVPEHRLPQCYFDSLSQNKQTVVDTTKKKQPPTKKLKSKEIIHDDTASTSILTMKQKKRSVTSSTKSSSECNVQFREIDPDFFKLLKMELSFDTSESGVLSITSFIFILKDLVRKLHTVILGKKAPSSHLNMIRPKDLIRDLIKMLPYIKSNFLIVKGKLDELLVESDGRQDLPEIFTEDANQLKMCSAYILECYSIILNWPDLQQAKNMEILRGALEALRTDDARVNSITFLASELISVFGGYVDQCLLISQGVFLVKILKCLNSFSPNGKRKKKIDSVCKDLLSRRWYNESGALDSGKNFTANLNYLVNAYLDSMKVAQVKDLVDNILTEYESLKTKDDYLTMLASIDFKNFYVLYQCLCGALHASVKKEIQSLTNNGHLELWNNTTITMSNLMKIARTSTNKLCLSSYLKKSIAILKIFISHGIPIFEIMFSSHMDPVVEILKCMQSSTRFLHHLCCDSKMKKNSSLVPHIPHFKLMLEQLIYKVKALLAANNCTNAFFMGNLKNKDIEGNTQLSAQSDDESQAEEETVELPGEDSDDETIIDEQEVSGNKSDSDVFD